MEYRIKIKGPRDENSSNIDIAYTADEVLAQELLCEKLKNSKAIKETHEQVKEQR